MGLFHPRAYGPHGSQRDVVAERDSPQEMCSTDAELLACSERRGYDGASRMRPSRSEVIVGFIGVGEFAVRKCRFDWAAENRGGNHGGDFFPTVATGKLDRQPPGRQFRPRNHSGESVENMVLGLFDHFVGKRMLAGLIVSLPETERYMKKVPATARRLELAAGTY